MSVMTGFREELVNRILGINGHLVVYANNGKLIENYNDISKKVSDDNNVFSVIPQIDGQGLARSKDYVSGVMIKGIRWTDLPAKKLLWDNLNKITKENFKTKNEIIIGSRLAKRLNVKIGDKITIMSPVGVQTLVGNLPKQEIFKITSIFDSGLSDYNENVAYINLKTLENLFDKNENQRFLEFYFKNPREVDSLKKKLSNIYDGEYIYTWADLNSSLFSALRVERNVMFIILSLIIIVAAFNIISGLTILVKNKTRDIGILKSIGVQNSSIKKIFFMIGFIIGTSATIFGVIIGTLFSIYIENIRNFISEIFNITLFPEEIYFLSKMPSEIDPQSIILISFCSIISTVIVSIFPATQAAKLDAVKTLKYE